MYPGLGTGDIPRKMFMVKFGRDKYSYILSKILDILNVYAKNSFITSAISFSSHISIGVNIKMWFSFFHDSTCESCLCTQLDEYFRIFMSI